MSIKKKDTWITTIALRMLLNPEWYKPSDPWRGYIEFLRRRLTSKQYYIKKHHNALEGVSKTVIEVWRRDRATSS